MKRLVLGALVLAAVLVTAQEKPQMGNGNVVDRAMSGTLASTIQALAASGQTVWVGYAVPVVDGEHHMCCFNFRHMDELKRWSNCCGSCRLERNGEQSFMSGRENDCAPTGAKFFVTARVSGGKVDVIRSYSSDCSLDLGGKTLYWLGDPPPAESLAWLAGFAQNYGEERGDKVSDGALSAIAFHKDAGADVALQRFLAPDVRRSLRQQAAFWLGNTRGQRGFEIVRDAVRNDQDSKFREEATFALSQSDVPAAEQELIRLAHQDSDRDVRGQALFWLAQKAGRRAGKAITDAIENDPDTEVKKKAVFSLSQMDSDEGVPLLISVAKTNKNPVVRKEAIFWLGQSNDARALDYIESILKQ
jgi:hypothetical protein